MPSPSSPASNRPARGRRAAHLPARSPLRAVLLLLFPALLLSAACGNGTTLPTGTARVVVRPLVAETYIDRMTVTVSAGPGPAAFPPLVSELTRSGNQWNGRIAGIPAGSQRAFDVVAFDAQGNGLFAAFARGDVAAGAATVVSLTLDNRPPAGSQNAFPVIDSISWSPEAPEPASVVQFRVTAHDPDPGDPLAYAWTADCGVFGDAATSTPRWTAPPRQGPCHLTVSVSDSHGAKVGFDFTVPVAFSTGGAGVDVTVNSWPVIGSIGGALVVKDDTLEGDLTVQASDPDGNTLSYAWESNCKGIAFKLTPPSSVTAPHVTLPLASAPCTVTVGVSDGVAPTATTATLVLSAEAVRLNCQNVVCLENQLCDPLDGRCKPKPGCTPLCTGKACGADGCGGSCGSCLPQVQACNGAGQCVGVCAPACRGRNCGPDGCGGSCGGCDAATMTCSDQGQCVSKCTPACAGKACGPDGCGGSCGACAPGTQTCSAAGQCVSSCVPACGGKSCGPDGCSGQCGACDPATQTCSAAGQCVSTCVPACSGKACGPDGCGGQCGTCAPGSQTCSAAGQCVSTCVPACSGKACGPDGCGGQCGTCSAGAPTCSAAGQCVAAVTQVVPVVARDVQAVPPGGLAMDAAGNAYLAATLTADTVVDFQTEPGGPPLELKSSGGIDGFVARYGPSGRIAWARAIGDDDTTQATDQTVTGVAVSGLGRVGLIGKIVGAVTFGSRTITSASGAAYLAALSAADGSRLWGAGFDLGSNGTFRAVSAGANDAAGRFAVCGQAVRAATSLAPGATYAGLLDVVVAVFDSAGNKVWAAQIGSAGNETCSAIAVDDNGDVFAAGQLDGASLTFPGTSPVTLTGPGSTARKFLWVARFAGAGNGAGGANTLKAAVFSGPSGVILPQSAAADAAGDLFLAGSFSGAPTLGAPVASWGSDDAFLVKLGGGTLAPVFNAVAFGGSGSDAIKGLAVTSAGDAVVTGTVNPSSQAFKADAAKGNGHDTAGALRLDVNGATAPDQFVAKFDGRTGAAQGAAVYGDPASQYGDSIAACRAASSDLVVFGSTLIGSASFGAAGTLTAKNLGPGGTAGADVALVFSQLR